MLIRKGSDRAFVRSVNTPFLFCAFVYVLALSSSCAIFFSKKTPSLYEQLLSLQVIMAWH